MVFNALQSLLYFVSAIKLTGFEDNWQVSFVDTMAVHNRPHCIGPAEPDSMQRVHLLHGLCARSVLQLERPTVYPHSIGVSIFIPYANHSTSAVDQLYVSCASLIVNYALPVVTVNEEEQGSQAPKKFWSSQALLPAHF